MADDLSATLASLREFRDQRDWAQFHTLGHLAAAMSIEASELQELFLWRSADEQQQVLTDRRADVEDELADVLITALNFALTAEIDPVTAIHNKVEKNCLRYPIDKSRGTPAKHTEL